jgi:hypothetical protein
VGEALRSLGGVTSLRKGGIANDIVIEATRENLTVLIDGRACTAHVRSADPLYRACRSVRVVGRDRRGPFDVTNQALGGP